MAGEGVRQVIYHGAFDLISSIDLNSVIDLWFYDFLIDSEMACRICKALYL